MEDEDDLVQVGSMTSRPNDDKIVPDRRENVASSEIDIGVDIESEEEANEEVPESDLIVLDPEHVYMP